MRTATASGIDTGACRRPLHASGMPKRITRKEKAGPRVTGSRPRTASDRLGPRRHQATDDAEYELTDRMPPAARDTRLPERVPGRRLDRQGDEFHLGEARAAHDAPCRGV